jgi:hypothetical protein
MSNEENVQDAQPEAVEAVEATEAPTESEIVAEALDIKVSRPSAMPVTDDGGVIGSPNTKKKGGTKSGSATTLDSGAIGSKFADADAKKAAKQKGNGKSEVSDKVAIFSTKNVSWPIVGKVNKGYNVVSTEAAEKWLTRSHTRKATAEEIAKEYGI